MKLPDAVKAVRTRYVARFPVPQTPGGGDAHEEKCRQWSIRFAEQVAFELPGQGWGVKTAGGGRPISKDTIARQLDGKLLVWDLLIGTGTGTPTINPDPDGEEVTGQTFVPVTPTGHLAGSVSPEPAPGPQPSVDLGPLVAELAALRGEVTRLATRITALEQPHEDGLGPALTELQARVAALDARRYRVQGATAREIGHAHPLDLPVDIVP